MRARVCVCAHSFWVRNKALLGLVFEKFAHSLLRRSNRVFETKRKHSADTYDLQPKVPKTKNKQHAHMFFVLAQPARK